MEQILLVRLMGLVVAWRYTPDPVVTRERTTMEADKGYFAED